MVDRVIIMVLDGFGVGEAPDANKYGDEGSNTFAGIYNNTSLNVPNMAKLGIYNIDGVKVGEKQEKTIGAYGKAQEQADGKNSPVGHWEMSGYIKHPAFTTYPNAFPKKLIDEFIEKTGVKGVLCNEVGSGTEILKRFGEEHIKTGYPIIYTSADSVFQIAAHEDVIPVEKLYETYSKEIFPQYNVEFLHGKMKPREKDEIMEKFKDGKIDILISTTVIEVGVDVPNSNIMVVENAERFGLAQLHQLRGRVGRGEYKSYCILKYEGKSENVKKRMKVMCETNDGFIISEKDLELRGSGDFFGTMQHGLPEFKIANLFEDIDMLKMVQTVAMKILEKEENKPLRALIQDKFRDRIEI